MNKQALTEALAPRLIDPSLLPIYEAARLVERLLPGVCEHGETTEHGAFRPGVPGSSWMCPGQVWDEGIVEAVGKVIYDSRWGANSWDADRPAGFILEDLSKVARAVLSALVDLLTEKVET